jgi:hypothetical protein
MRLPKSDLNLVSLLQKRGYHIEEETTNKDTWVVSVPIRLAKGVRTLKEVSMWEQVSLAAFLQRHWADNQVSCTVTFKETEASQISIALDHFQYHLKGISFLPEYPILPYQQMPYEEITEERYRLMAKELKLAKENKRPEGYQCDLENGRPDDYCDACENNLI